MSWTANMMRRMPSVFAGASSGSEPTAVGVWNFISSSRPWPSGVRIIATSTLTPSSPTTLSAQRPSTRLSPSSSSPSSAKNSIAAARSSTTMPTLSIRSSTLVPSSRDPASRRVSSAAVKATRISPLYSWPHVFRRRELLAHCTGRTFSSTQSQAEKRNVTSLCCGPGWRVDINCSSSGWPQADKPEELVPRACRQKEQCERRFRNRRA
jgi:hypothetical protein